MQMCCKYEITFNKILFTHLVRCTEQMIRKDIPELLKQKRIEKGLTLEEASKILGVSKTTYRDYENGVLLVDNMKIEKLIPLSLFLNIYPNELFDLVTYEGYNKFNKYQFKELMITAIKYNVPDFTEDEKQYLIKSIELICK